MRARKNAAPESVLTLVEAARNTGVLEEPDQSYNPPYTPSPMDHPPGSEEKVRELARRVVAGEQLWHPDDFGVGDYMKLWD